MKTLIAVVMLFGGVAFADGKFKPGDRVTYSWKSEGTRKTRSMAGTVISVDSDGVHALVAKDSDNPDEPGDPAHVVWCVVKWLWPAPGGG